MTNFTATAKDTNGNQIGQVTATINFYSDDCGTPFAITYKNQLFCKTGKTGTNFASGKPVFELATEDDARLWLTADLTQVFED